MAFPVTVAGTTYTLSDFSPLGYVTALPNSIQSMGDEYLRLSYGTSTSSMLIGGGSKSFTTQANLNWKPNVTIVRMYNSSSNMMEGVLTAYNSSTGAATVNVTATAGAGTFASWNVCELLGAAGNGNVPLGPQSYFNGGTGNLYSNPINNRANFHGFGPWQGMSTVWEDFNFDFSLSTDGMGDWLPYSNTGSSNMVNNDSFCQGAFGTSHYGIIGMHVTNPKDGVALSYGSGGFMSVAESGDFLFVTQVYIPTLSDVNNRFNFRIGLRGTKSSQYDTIFDAGGIGFEYSDNINSGFWTVVYNNGQSKTYASSPYPGLVVFSGTWYTLCIYGNKKNNVVYFKIIAGLSGAQVTFETAANDQTWGYQASLENWPVDNKYFVHPCMTIRKVTGTGQRFAYVDYIWLSKSLTGVR